MRKTIFIFAALLCSPPDCGLAGESLAPTNAPLWQPYRVTPRAGVRHVSLDGNWRLGWRDDPIGAIAQLETMTNWLSAQVPSTVQWALHRAGKCGHPYEHLNSKQYEWVDQKVWYYRRAFECPTIPEGGRAFLCFDGIDYFARVWLNGVLLGRHEGMFGGPDVEVARHIRAGAANDLIVEVRAANFGGKKEWKPRGPEGSVIKPWVIAGGTGGEMFFPLGMWRGARIEVTPACGLERPFLVTKTADDKSARLSLEVEVTAGTLARPPQLHPWGNSILANGSGGWEIPPRVESKYELRVALTDKGSEKVVFDKRFPLDLREGRNWVREEFSIEDPRLWWPVGMGEPVLHRARFTLMKDGRDEDTLEFDHGIRTVECEPTPGPRTTDRWADWQFRVNGRRLFIKGMNWMPADILLDLPRERYRWLVGTAKAAGIQLFRVWGGGILETEEFYDACNELGVMVWQDFPIGNRCTPEWPQDVWEAQVMHAIYRLRNHPSLAVWCGGNEFNPYSIGNAATIGILERCLADFDPTRPMRRTSPDAGSMHAYPDMDPTWYGDLYRLVPFIAETGMHSIPDPGSLRELIDPEELNGPLKGMMEKQFPLEHPELMQHFVEYQASRVPRMLSRASHIADVSSPSLETLAESTQIGAGEFYQIFSDQVQANYPVTAGLMPWVYKRPWPVIAIMLVDGFGQPTAPYYFLKRTYEPTHVMVKLPHLMWGKGERVPIDARVIHAPDQGRAGLVATVDVLDAAFESQWHAEKQVDVAPGPSVASLDLGSFEIPDRFEETFFFILVELRDGTGRSTSRSVYWPRCLARMGDEAFRVDYRAKPRPTLTLDKGPWLKMQTASQQTSLEVALKRGEQAGTHRERVLVRVKNGGGKPAFNTRVDIEGAKRLFCANDNFFWLAPGEEKEIDMDVVWREADKRGTAEIVVGAWNAPVKRLKIEGERQ